MLEKNLDKVNWYRLSKNPNAISILENNLDKVNWVGLSINPNPNAISILENNINNLHKVDWNFLSENPSIFQIDYDEMRENFHEMAEEIAKIVWHPSRMSKWPEDNLLDEADNLNNIQSISTIRDIKICIKLRS
jgi:hypothetical protein